MPPAKFSLAFDVFGTVVDWRGSIVRSGARVDPSGFTDWDAFAQDWMGEYGKKAVPYWVNLDARFVAAFYRVARRHGIDHGHDEMAFTWSRLEMWPDAKPGFKALRAKGYPIEAFSNANYDMMRSIGEGNGFVWDRIYSAEAVRAMKPDAAMYYQLDPGTMVVAAHCFDLNHAHSHGYRTALITRAGEPGSDPSGLNHTPDLIVKDVLELAEQL